MKREYAVGAGVAFVAGAVAGSMLWTNQVRYSKRDLFSRSPIRRLAALGYVGALPSVENAGLLRDYVAWESRPALRRRADVLLRRMETLLG
jgi:hypothetical protein